MDIFNLLTEPQELYKMSQKEFVEKTKEVLNKILNSYFQGWQSRVLRDGEHPEENVCDECPGSGLFIKDGEEKVCVQDNEAGECFYQFCDYEQIVWELEPYIEDMLNLCSVDEIIEPEQEGRLLLSDVVNYGCSDCGGKLKYDVMNYWQCSICGKPQ